MRKIMFSILFLWMSTMAFGQSMDWTYLSSNPGVTYVDDTKLTYESADGLLKVEYELVRVNGENILYYDIQVTPTSGDPIIDLEYWGYSEGSIYEEEPHTSLWDEYDGAPLSGSVILNQGDPESLNLAVRITKASYMEHYFGFFTTYDPN
ncbi:hypothetical protein FAZ19_04380 [Sphingobacterium alkalisoli]|uniref:Uncharacterized protein n=1 Tax=Sphingobacterium alkalisoli TaxID=1874115 RepID=A0A4U0H9M4_9SPHI|nr:hypothetical protein [Sphingobacterium alkalisoli]TJY68498.1 hypothetical protein FAZ19_04380 [Sphingobacterium alkalisoli]GGH06073.1 hypothetical protein GCM10011418_02600 [Sphingobacterium alkalisoli]